MRAKSLIISITFVGIGLLVGGRSGSSKVLNIHDFGGQTNVAIDPSIFIPHFPIATAVPQPTETPEATDEPSDPSTPIGFYTDANDYLLFFYTNTYQVKIGSGDAKDYSAPNWFKFHFAANEGVTPIDLAVGVKILAAGQFQIQIGNYDASKFNLSFSVEDLQGNAQGDAVELAPDEKLVIKADSLSSLTYDGESPVAANAPAKETIGIVNDEVIYIFSQRAGSDLRIRAKDMIGPEDVPEDNGNQPTPTPNHPSGNNPPPSNPPPTDDTSTPTGGTAVGDFSMRGGGSRLLSCSLHGSAGSALGQLMVLATLSLGGLSLLRLRLKRRGH